MTNLVLNFTFILFLVIVLVFVINEVEGEMCKRKDIFTGSEEIFNCPRVFESRKKRHCCGSTTLQGYCCEWSKKSRDLLADPGTSRALFESFLNIIVVVLLIVGGLIATCCVCVCVLMSRKRQYRGQILSQNETGTTLPTVNPSVNPYPQQNMNYQMSAIPMDQPPPYPYPAPQPAFNPSYPTK